MNALNNVKEIVAMVADSQVRFFGYVVERKTHTITVFGNTWEEAQARKDLVKDAAKALKAPFKIKRGQAHTDQHCPFNTLSHYTIDVVIGPSESF